MVRLGGFSASIEQAIEEGGNPKIPPLKSNLKERGEGVNLGMKHHKDEESPKAIAVAKFMVKNGKKLEAVIEVEEVRT